MRFPSGYQLPKVLAEILSEKFGGILAGILAPKMEVRSQDWPICVNQWLWNGKIKQRGGAFREGLELELGAELELGPLTFNNLGFLSSLHWLAMQIRAQVLSEVCGLFALAGKAMQTGPGLWMFLAVCISRQCKQAPDFQQF